ncbi:MAG: ABC transporter ATP-binding protein [Hyphomicrobiales bacterium]|nr:ABC transporter ATP-binding protein [Hyphomicrobiales bacterium]
MLEVRNLCKNFGGLAVAKNISLSLKKGERRVVLGPNGAGKTTLFNLLAGTLTPTSGSIILGGRNITRAPVEKRARLGLARSYQKNNLFEGLTVRENLGLAATTASGRTASLRCCAHDGAEMQDIIAEVAEQVGLSDSLDKPVSSCPYGNRRQLEVGLALAARPKLLLMDEPTSGVGPNMIDAFDKLIHALPRDLTMLIIEHDFDLGFNVADSITVLNYGEVVFEGSPEATRQSREVKEIYLGDWNHA